MKKLLQSLVLLLAVLLPNTASAGYVQVADGVYQDASKLFISSGVTSLGSLQLSPSVIYCYATIPPACVSNTFMSYGATLHVPTSSMVSYFSAQYWYNFTNVLADAVEPKSVSLSQESVEIEIGQQLTLNASVNPQNATPNTVYWSSTNTEVATVSGGKVTAVGIGECYIRAICVDKQELCHVVVTPERVTISLDKQEVRLLPNHLVKLTATCSPEVTNLLVTSNNTAVAIPRYVNGMIQVVGVAEGTATITVETADGWCHPAECEVTVYTELGDVNCDGFVNIGDVTDLIDHLLGINMATFNAKNADADRDGTVNISDVTMLIDYLLGISHNGYKFEKVWEIDVNTLGFVVNDVRQGFGMDGKVYINDKANQTIYVINENGFFGTLPGGTNCGISCDEAGNILVSNAPFPGPWDEDATIKVINPNTGETKEYMVPLQCGLRGRCDFIGFAKGNFFEEGTLYLTGGNTGTDPYTNGVAVFSVAGGEVDFDNCYTATVEPAVTGQTSTVINYYKDLNGDDALLYAYRSGAPSKLMVDGNIFTKTDISLPNKGGCNGCFAFVWDGMELYIYPTRPNYWNGFAISEAGAEAPMFEVAPTVSANMNGFQNNWVNAEVDETGVTIYQYAPGANISVYRLSKTL